MSTELSGLELRKAACEALGWVIAEDDCRRFHLMRPDGGSFREVGLSVDISGLVEMMPAIESDPAVSEPLFLEWCAKKELLFDLYSTPENGISCVVYRFDHNGDHAHVFGATPSEARARCIVAASKGGQ